MPRIPEAARTIPHDFAWNIFLEPDQVVFLFERDVALTGVDFRHRDHAGKLSAIVEANGAHMNLKRIAISRPDVVLGIWIEGKEWTFSGPQYERGVDIDNEQLRVPDRRRFRPSIHLLPGAAAGPVLVHLATTFHTHW